MAFDDYLEPEVGIAVAVTAAVASPKVRGVLRKGAVYGVAGVLMAGDAISSLVRGVSRNTMAPAADGAPAGTGSPQVVAATEYTPIPPDAAAAEPDASAEASHHAPKRSRTTKNAEAADNE